MSKAKQIVEGMAYALWAHALAGYCEDTRDGRWISEYEDLVRGGGAGAELESAMKPAMELANLYEIANGATLVSLYQKIPFGYFTDAYDYGEALAKRALGVPDETMVAARDRALDSVEPVSFEISFDGNTLVWTGDSQPPTTNPAGDEWGVETTRFALDGGEEAVVEVFNTKEDAERRSRKLWESDVRHTMSRISGARLAYIKREVAAGRMKVRGPLRDNPAHGPTRAGEHSRFRTTIRGVERATAVIPRRHREYKASAPRVAAGPIERTSVAPKKRKR